MADNTVLPAGSGGDTIEDIDGANGTGGVKRPVVALAGIGKSGSHTALTAGQKTMANSIPVVVASDQSAIPVSNAAITPGSSAALEGSHVLKASAGSLYSLYCLASVAGYLMTFNATTVPADGAVTPVECIPVGAGQVASIDFGAAPDAYSTGIVAVFSTTGPFTKTISGTAFFKWRVV